jgi:hypothetical protein
MPSSQDAFQMDMPYTHLFWPTPLNLQCFPHAPVATCVPALDYPALVPLRRYLTVAPTGTYDSSSGQAAPAHHPDHLMKRPLLKPCSTLHEIATSVAGPPEPDRFASILGVFVR